MIFGFAWAYAIPAVGNVYGAEGEGHEGGYRSTGPGGPFGFGHGKMETFAAGNNGSDGPEAP